MEEKLTERQKRFADIYIETGNATESYKRAGYNCSSESVYNTCASDLLRNAKVKNYIDKAIEGKDSDRIAKQDEVLEYYTQLMRGQLTDEIVMMSPKGSIIRVEQRVENRVRSIGAKELAKRYGIDKPLKEDEKDKYIQVEIMDFLEELQDED